MFETTIPTWDIAVRLGAACLIGLVLGLDRELQGKAAGLRTHMLVCLGAATTTLIAFELFFTLDSLQEGTNADPIRTIEGVAAAIGFLGAGVIIQGGDKVRGLTTAANIWIAGALGIACGAGYYTIAVIGFALTFVILIVLGRIEDRVENWAAKRRRAREEEKSKSG